MAVYLPKSDTLILLPAKTGSRWIRSTLSILNVPHAILGPRELRGHGTLAFYGTNFRHIACFIRKPFDWHYSYWNYRTNVLKYWEGDRIPHDKLCGNLDFEGYLKCIIKNFPNRVERYFERFIGPPDRRIQNIGHLENIENDFINLLDQLDENFSKDLVHKIGKINSHATTPEFTNLRQLVYESDRNFYIEFGYSL